MEVKKRTLFVRSSMPPVEPPMDTVRLSVGDWCEFPSSYAVHKGTTVAVSVAAPQRDGDVIPSELYPIPPPPSIMVLRLAVDVDPFAARLFQSSSSGPVLNGGKDEGFHVRGIMGLRCMFGVMESRVGDVLRLSAAARASLYRRVMTVGIPLTVHFGAESVTVAPMEIICTKDGQSGTVGVFDNLKCDVSVFMRIVADQERGCLVGRPYWGPSHQHLLEDIVRQTDPGRSSFRPLNAARGAYVTGPHGVGKTHIVSHVCRAVEREGSGVWSLHLNATDLLGDTLRSTARKVMSVIQTTCRMEPSVLVLDGLDSLALPALAPLPTTRLLILEILKLFDRIEEESLRVFVICVATNRGSVPSHWLGPHRLSQAYTLSCGNAAARVRLLTELRAEHGCTWSDKDVLHLGALTNSWLPCEVAALAQHRAFPLAQEHCRRHTPTLVLQASHVSVMHSFDIDPCPYFVDITLCWSRLLDCVVFPMQNLDLLGQCGVRPPRGVLLHGPSGCGKTALLRRLAFTLLHNGEGTSSVNVLLVDATSMISKYVGESERNLHELFTAARSAAPCILLVDHLERLATRRGESDSSTSDRVLSTLLTEMDGIESSSSLDCLVIVIGSTERLGDLDAAALRAGRFDVHIGIPLPSLEDKVKLARALIDRMPSHIGEETLRNVLQSFDVKTFADVEHCCASAAWSAARREAEHVEDVDF